MERFIFNLQLFNNTNTTGTSTLSPENKTFYDKQLIRLAEAELVHDQFGQKRNIPKNGGKTIEFRKFSPLAKATTPLTEGVTPDGQALTVTSITADVAQYGGYVELSDILDMTAIDNVVVETLSLIGSQAGRTLDTITRDVLAGGTNVIYANGSTRAGLVATDTMTVDLIRQAATQLKRNNTPTINGNYVAIVHPDVAHDLKASQGWIDVHKYDDPTPIFEGEIGKFDNVRFVESTEAKVWKDDTCPSGLAVFGTLVLGANAFGTTNIEGGGLETIVKQRGSAGTADPLDQRSTIGWKATKVAERLVENYMVRIETCSSYSAVESAN